MAKHPSNEKWESFLEECLESHGFSTFRLTINVDENIKKCSGTMLKVLVEGRQNRDFKIEYLMMKAIDDLKNAPKFKTESFIYNEVLPKFNKMQSDLARSQKIIFPFCYKSTDEYVVMEDLKLKNFAVEEKLLDFDQTVMALTNLGMFHAFSFALRHQNYDDFESWTKDLNRDFFSYPENNEEAMEAAVKLMKDSIDDDLKPKISIECKQPIKDHNYTIICHGDYTSKNLLYAIDEDLEPTDLMIIDYQLSSVSSPVTDVHTLILSSSKPEIFPHYEALTEIYYDSLRLFLKKFQCLIKDCYPANVFHDDLNKYFNSSLARTLLDLKNLINNDDTSQYNGNWYKKRVNDIIRALDENCKLTQK